MYIIYIYNELRDLVTLKNMYYYYWNQYLYHHQLYEWHYYKND